MSGIIILQDDNLDTVLHDVKPVMLLLSDGSGLRSDFSIAFKKAAQEKDRIVFAQIDPTKNPIAAERFEMSDKPVLLVWYCGETLARRSRPWGSDVALTIELLENAYAANQPESVVSESIEEKSMTNSNIPTDKPVNVTDETFEELVLQSDLPVLVDYWAEWCGPCRMVAPILDKLAKEFAGQIRIAKVDVDSNPGLSQTFQIRSIPNLMAIKNRTIVFNQPGALPEAPLRDLIQQLIKLEVPVPETRQQPEPSE